MAPNTPLAQTRFAAVLHRNGLLAARLFTWKPVADARLSMHKDLTPDRRSAIGPDAAICR